VPSFSARTVNYRAAAGRSGWPVLPRPAG
jgi:hypothetical protein